MTRISGGFSLRSVGQHRDVLPGTVQALFEGAVVDNVFQRPRFDSEMMQQGRAFGAGVPSDRKPFVRQCIQLVLKRSRRPSMRAPNSLSVDDRSSPSCFSTSISTSTVPSGACGPPAFCT